MKRYVCLLCEAPINPDDWDKIGERFCCVACRDHWCECRGDDLHWALANINRDTVRIDAWETLRAVLTRHYAVEWDDSPPAEASQDGPVRVRRMQAGAHD